HVIKNNACFGHARSTNKRFRKNNLEKKICNIMQRPTTCCDRLLYRVNDLKDLVTKLLLHRDPHLPIVGLIAGLIIVG
ncbi:MAG: hypothetical protein WBA57_23820, partial [Elainellaceae cyanobacterium]